MTVGELICEIEKARPGSVMSLKDCFAEINRTAMDIHENILSNYEGASPLKSYGDEAELIDIPENYAEIYKYRLLAKTDALNGDITRYTNNMILYNDLLSEFRDWYNRTRMPRQRAELRWK